MFGRKKTKVLQIEYDSNRHKLIIRCSICTGEQVDGFKSDEELMQGLQEVSFVFSKIGLLYYDNDNICPGTYFCYKVAELG